MSDFDAEDLRQIQNLLADYGATVDEARWEDHLALWTEDCEMLVFGRSYRGKDAIGAFIGKTTRGKHVTAAPHLEFIGDKALGVADYIFFRASDLKLYSAGVYRDEFTRQGGTWRLHRREIDIQLSDRT